MFSSGKYIVNEPTEQYDSATGRSAAKPKMTYKKITCIIGAFLVLILVIGYGWFHIWQQNGALTIHKSTEPTNSEQINQNELGIRRKFIKQMAKEAWAVYRQFGWGSESVNPQTEHKHSGQMPGQAILASMSTLWLMGLEHEFDEGKQWIRESKPYFGIDQGDSVVSVYDIVSQYIGGLLSCFAFTNDQLFRDKAKEMADFVGPVYNVSNVLPGLPTIFINPQTRSPMSPHPLLSDILNQQLEYLYLFYITSDPQYSDRVIHIRESLRKLKSLRPEAIDLKTGNWTDSLWEKVMKRRENAFYASLVQVYLQSNGTDFESINWYEKALDLLNQKRLIKSWKRGSVYVRSYFHTTDSDYLNNDRKDFMNTYQCSLAGILTLGTKALITNLDQIDSLNLEAKANETEQIRTNTKLAEDIIDTCHLAANSSTTGLPPARFYFDKQHKATNEDSKESFYDLKPELAESYFLMYRLTRDEKYRTYAWQLAQSIQLYARTLNGGYMQVQNVNQIPTVKDGDAQPNTFLSGTLKYLYLTFSDKLVPLDRWVFNSVGHPLPVIGEVSEDL